MSLSDITPDLRRRAESHYENIVRALFQQRGFAAPSPGQLGQIVQGAVAGASAAELRAAESASPAIIGRIDQLVTGAMEAGRPRNIHSAEAARLAQLGDQAAAGVLGVKGAAELLRARAEARAEARERAERYAGLPAAGDRVSSAVMSAYVGQYAGTGLGRGTVQTFAEIGLQRGIYDAYRREGFSREDIGDAAKTAKALDWKHDRQAFDDVQRSSRPERAALVAINGEQDAEQRKALIERKRRELHIDEKPQADQDRWNRNVDRVQQHHHDADRRHGIGTSAKQADASLTGTTATDAGRPALAKVRVAALEAGKSRGGTTEVAGLTDDFKVPSNPAHPIKGADARPAAPGPKIG